MQKLMCILDYEIILMQLIRVVLKGEFDYGRKEKFIGKVVGI